MDEIPEKAKTEQNLEEIQRINLRTMEEQFGIVFSAMYEVTSFLKMMDLPSGQAMRSDYALYRLAKLSVYIAQKSNRADTSSISPDIIDGTADNLQNSPTAIRYVFNVLADLFKVAEEDKEKLFEFLTKLSRMETAAKQTFVQQNSDILPIAKFFARQLSDFLNNESTKVVLKMLSNNTDTNDVLNNIMVDFTVITNVPGINTPTSS